nr:MAG TPA: hypothetical protein [Caudoviricetes sp.]
MPYTKKRLLQQPYFLDWKLDEQHYQSFKYNVLILKIIILVLKELV